MSAVPKKKLCWNCEGNVATDLDNCPYCGVYIHFSEIEENTHWNPSYHPSSQTEDSLSFLYKIPVDQTVQTQEESPSDFHLLTHLKKDIFPILFLMTGSLFFLFGVVLFLFSENGTFTLQWQEHYAYYFLSIAFPLIIFGWQLLQQLEDETKQKS